MHTVSGPRQPIRLGRYHPERTTHSGSQRRLIARVFTVEAMRAVMRWPRWAQFALLAAIGIALYWWQHDGRARRHAATVVETAKDVWRVIEPSTQ
jgi:hypothetical protein